MSPLSSLHNASNSVRWAGPAMAAIGLLLTVLIAVTGQQSLFSQWFWSQALGPERTLPLLGLGFALGLVRLRIFFASLVLLIIGIVAGFAAYDPVMYLLYIAWEAPSHFSLTGPVSCLFAGLPLLCSERLRAWLLPVAAVVVGAMLAIAIFLNDPSDGDPLFTWAPLVGALWIIIAVSLTVRAFRRNWLVVFGRILGSWTVAIGVLYGATSAVLVLKPIPSSNANSQEPARGAEFTPPGESGSAVDGKTGGNPHVRTLWQRRTPGQVEAPQH
ncbi:MAG TPA: hypothetical protein VMF12_00715 [Xanthobacteraceae bacterium]|nr:hypothetical protein [Xanthobacteraceae bacterium]